MKLSKGLYWVLVTNLWFSFWGWYGIISWHEGARFPAVWFIWITMFPIKLPFMPSAPCNPKLSCLSGVDFIVFKLFPVVVPLIASCQAAVISLYFLCIVFVRLIPWIYLLIWSHLNSFFHNFINIMRFYSNFEGKKCCVLSCCKQGPIINRPIYTRNIVPT